MFQIRIETYIEDLKQTVVDEVTAVYEGLRRRVFDELQKPLRECIDVNEGHLRDGKNIEFEMYVK